VSPYTGNYPPLAAAPQRFLPEREAPPAASADWCRTRQAIATIARAEERIWTKPNGTKFRENDNVRRPDLIRYWRAVPGFGSPADAAAAAGRSARDERDGEWSAAFVCSVLRSAGIRKADGFEFGQRHLDYIVGALRNRERSDHARPFWLVDALEMRLEAIPRIGDLLCFNRETSPGRWTPHSYASLRREYCSGGHQNVAPRGSSHCSIVVGFRAEPGGGRSIETIGGNEGNTVLLQHAIPIDRSGGVPNPAANHIFGMIKLTGC
jgi:Uncharacterized protein conserved in bacteria (DUF2272)